MQGSVLLSVLPVALFGSVGFLTYKKNYTLQKRKGGRGVTLYLGGQIVLLIDSFYLYLPEHFGFWV